MPDTLRLPAVPAQQQPLPPRQPRDLLSAHEADLMRARVDRLTRLSGAMLSHTPPTEDQRIQAADAMLAEALDLRARVDAAIDRWMETGR